MNALAKVSCPKQAHGRSRENFEQLVGYLDSVEASLMTHSELERELEKRGRELMRRMLQEHLDSRSPGRCEDPVCGADGRERTRQRRQKRKLETVFGSVRVERTDTGLSGAESLHPLDAELNLPDKLELELRRRVAEEAAKNSYEETLESIAKTTGSASASAKSKSLSSGLPVTLTLFTRSGQKLPKIEPPAPCWFSAPMAKA